MNEVTPLLNNCPKWEHPLHANLSHISISEDGRRILVSSSFHQTGARKENARLQMFNEKGRLLWTKGLPQPVKSQSLSSDGQLIAISTYEGKLRVLNGNGKRLWEEDRFGCPIVLSEIKSIMLLNDDDSEPQTTFAVYDDKGTRKTEVQSSKEPVEFSVAKPNHVLASSTGGHFSIYDIQGNLIANGLTSREIISATLTYQNNGYRIDILSFDSKADKTQKITSLFFDSTKKWVEKWSLPLQKRYEILRASKKTIFVYGNSKQGQTLAAVDAQDGKQIWEKFYPYSGVYSSLVFVFEEFPQAISRSMSTAQDKFESFITVAMEKKDPAGSYSLFAADSQGQLLWDVPVTAEDGIFSYGYAPKAPALAIGIGAVGSGILKYVKIGCDE